MKACPQCKMRYPEGREHCFVDGVLLEPLRDERLGMALAGRYVLEEVLGEGGMATVYRARHKNIDRPCAVKIMNVAFASDPVVRERFRREVTSTQRLSHPNVVEIYDHGELDDRTPYLVMELLEGMNLAELVAEGALPIARFSAIAIQIVRGIARAHDLGVVHRDLKPENIFLAPRADGTDLVKILDFGIARSRTDTRLTNDGELFGTPQYLAPERIVRGETGPSVDLYALGVIFFEVLTGKLPFTAKDATSFLVKHVKEAPPKPTAINPKIPETLETLVLDLLAKDPNKRPVDAHRVLSDLEAIASLLRLPVPPDVAKEPGSARPPSKSLPGAARGWVHRKTIFERMLSRAYGETPPDHMKQLLAEVSRLVEESSRVREASVAAERALEELEAKGREGRQRFGFAVDALGVDVSRARGELRQAETLAEESAKHLPEFGEAYRKAHANLLMWEGRVAFQEPHEGLAKAYEACADLVRRWLEKRTEVKHSGPEVQAKKQMVSDLEFQVRELRAALEAHEASYAESRRAGEAEVLRLSRRAEELEAELLGLATEFCAPLRTKGELSLLFSELEREVAA